MCDFATVFFTFFQVDLIDLTSAVLAFGESKSVLILSKVLPEMLEQDQTSVARNLTAAVEYLLEENKDDMAEEFVQLFLLKDDVKRSSQLEQLKVKNTQQTFQISELGHLTKSKVS